MKKNIYRLATLFLCLLLTSCGAPLDKYQSLIDDMKENGKTWDTDQWESFIRDVTETELAFWESEPTKGDVKNYEKLEKKATAALEKLLDKSKVEKAFNRAMKALDKDSDFKKLNKSRDKAEDKARKALRKKSKSDDEEEEEEDSDDEDY